MPIEPRLEREGHERRDGEPRAAAVELGDDDRDAGRPAPEQGSLLGPALLVHDGEPSYSRLPEALDASMTPDGVTAPDSTRTSSASTTRGSNWLPAQRAISSSASRARPRRAVQAVGRHRLVRVCDEQDTRADRDLFAREPVGVSAPVPAFVVVQHPRRDRFDAQRREHAVADLRVHGDRLVLRLGERARLAEDVLRHGDLAEVVQQPRDAQELHVLGGQPELFADPGRELDRPPANGYPCTHRARRSHRRATLLRAGVHGGLLPRSRAGRTGRRPRGGRLGRLPGLRPSRGRARSRRRARDRRARGRATDRSRARPRRRSRSRPPRVHGRFDRPPSTRCRGPHPRSPSGRRRRTRRRPDGTPRPRRAGSRRPGRGSCRRRDDRGSR